MTADDIGSLCFKLIVSTPDGPIDPMHVIIGIVAGAETLPAGTGATGLSRVVQDLPTSVSQRDVSTWVGDVGKAATEWMAALPQHGGLSDLDNLTKVDYLRESAPPHDLLGDVDGVAMTAKSLPSGFVFDKKASLSDNLRLFSRLARKMRFHIFCSVEGFALEADGVRLTSKTKATIGQRIYDFAMWYSKNDPDVWDWRSRYGDVLDDLWRKRYGNWQWFADQFITFVENGLAAEKAD